PRGAVTPRAVEFGDQTAPWPPAKEAPDPFARTATLDPTEPLAPRATYTAVVEGGDAGVKDLAGNALAADLRWTFTTIQSPQVLSVTPAPGANNIAPRVTPTAIFSEALDPKSLNLSTVVLSVGPFQSSYRIIYVPSVFRVMIVPTEPLQYGQTYTITLRGGPSGPRITNLAGTPLASNFTWSFTIAP